MRPWSWRRAGLGLALGLLIACTGGPDALAGAEAFSAERALADVRMLADQIGSRPAGSPAGRRAAAYLAGELAAAGLTVSGQPFDAVAFEDGGSSLVLDGAGPVAATTAVQSPAGEVAAPLVDAGFGRPEDFTPAAVRGRIALVTSGEIRNRDKVVGLAAAGALGVVIAGDRAGPFQARLDSDTPLPTVCLSQGDGQRLRGLLADRAVEVRLVVRASRTPSSGSNVVGDSGGSPGVVLIGAHYDTVEAGPGANDNGSGVATLLELARVTAGRAYPFGLRFVAFDGEEVGRLGSQAYVEALSDAERGAIVAMINLDMAGVGSRLLLGGEDGLVGRAAELVGALGLTPARLPDDGRSYSDHASFAAVGIPTLFVSRGRDPRYHTAADRFEFVRPEHLATVGRIVLDLLDRLAAP